MAKRTVDMTFNIHSAAAEMDVKSLAGETSDLGQTAARVQGEVRSSFGGIADAADVALGNVAAMAVEELTMQIGSMASEAVSIGADFEQGMDRVAALSQSTEAQLQQQTETARELGSSTAFSASEAAQGMQYLARTGYDVSQQIGAMPGLLDAAAAGQVDLGQAADTTSNILQGFGLQAEETGRVADVLTATFTTSNTDLRGLGETMQYVAPIAGELGLDLEEVAAAAGLMGDRGIQGSEAGTALRASINQLLNPSKQAQQVLDDLGVTVRDDTGEMKSLAEIMASVETATESMSKANRQAALAQVVGQEAVTGFTALLSSGSEEIAAYTQRLRESGGTAERVANQQIDNLRGDLEELGGAWEEVALSAYDVFGDELREGTQRTTELVRRLAEGVVTVDEFFEEWGDTIASTAPALATTGKAVGVAAAGVAGLRTAAMLSNATFAVTATRLTVASRAVSTYGVGTAAAAVAQRGYTTSVAAAATATRGLTAAMAANPIGFIATVISSAAAAWLLFRDNTNAATEAARKTREEVEKQGEAVRDLTEGIRALSGAQLVQREQKLQTELSNTNSNLRERRDELRRLQEAEKIEASATTHGVSLAMGSGMAEDMYRVEGEEDLLTQAEYRERHNAALNASVALDQQKQEAQEALVQVSAQISGDLNARITRLKEEHKALVGTNEETERLAEVREKLAELEERRRALRRGDDGNASGGSVGGGTAEEDRQRVELAKPEELQKLLQRTEEELRETGDPVSIPLKPDLPAEAFADAKRELRAIENLQGDGLIGSQEASRRRVDALSQAVNELSAAGKSGTEEYRRLKQQLAEAQQQAGSGDWGAEEMRAFGQKAAQMAQRVGQIFSSLHQRRIQQIRTEKNERIRSINEAEQRELDRIESQMDAAAAGSKKEEQLREKQDRVRQKYDDRREKAEEQFQIKQAEAKRKQAKMQKMSAIAEVGINTAVAISENLATPWMIPVVSALGAAQLAAVAAEPLPEVPEFAQGGIGLTRAGVIEGPGGPREDAVPATLDGEQPIRVSAGESIVTAASTAAAPRTLEAMNASPAAARRIEEMMASPAARFAGGGVAVGGHETIEDLRRRAQAQPPIMQVPPVVRQDSGGGGMDDSRLLGAIERLTQRVDQQTRRLDEQTERLDKPQPGRESTQRLEERIRRYRSGRNKSGR